MHRGDNVAKVALRPQSSIFRAGAVTHAASDERDGPWLGQTLAWADLGLGRPWFGQALVWNERVCAYSHLASPVFQRTKQLPAFYQRRLKAAIGARRPPA